MQMAQLYNHGLSTRLNTVNSKALSNFADRTRGKQCQAIALTDGSNLAH